MKIYIPKLKKVDENTLRAYVQTIGLIGEIHMEEVHFYSPTGNLVAKEDKYDNCYIWDGESFEEINVGSHAKQISKQIYDLFDELESK